MAVRNLSNLVSKILSEHILFSDAKVAVAVSGGADSLALLFVLKELLKSNNILAITVDHKLRTESESEAKYVSKLCKENDINHVIINWPKNLAKPNNQEESRIVRYKLISEECKKNNIFYLFTGHHKNDAIENFWIRVLRGSGIRGLASVGDFISYYESLKIIRPFLEVEKQTLKDFLLKQNISWCEDQSNSDRKYLRNNLRLMFEENNIDYHSNFTTIQNLNRTYEFYQEEYYKATTQVLTLYDYPLSEINLEEFKKLHEEFRLRILSDVILYIGDLNHEPRMGSIQLLNSSIDNSSKKKFTLGNSIIEVQKNSIYIYPEYIFPINIKLSPGETTITGKFEISLDENSSTEYLIQNFNPTYWDKLPKFIQNNKNIKKIRHHLPIFLDKDLNNECQIPKYITDPFLRVVYKPKRSFSSFKK